jgi:uncharacterized protein YjbK
MNDAQNREHFLAKAITIARQIKPDFHEQWGMDLEQFTHYARYILAESKYKVPMDYELMFQHARDVDVTHDFFGILNNWNVVSERMDNCFWPRCAKQLEDE